MNKRNSFRSILAAMLLANTGGSMRAMEEKIDYLSQVPKEIMYQIVFQGPVDFRGQDGLSTDILENLIRIRKFSTLSKHFNTVMLSLKQKFLRLANVHDAKGNNPPQLANLYDAEGNTPLTALISYMENKDIARNDKIAKTNMFGWLLAAGANPNAYDKTTKTPHYSPLYRISVEGCYELAALLVAAGANQKNLCQEAEETVKSPLFIAVKHGCPRTIAALLAGGANPNEIMVTNNEQVHERFYIPGNTLLHYFVTNYPKLKLLLENGANPLLRNSEDEIGDTPREHHLRYSELAEVEPNPNIIDLLEEYEEKWRAK